MAPSCWLLRSESQEKAKNPLCLFKNVPGSPPSPELRRHPSCLLSNSHPSGVKSDFNIKMVFTWKLHSSVKTAKFTLHCWIHIRIWSLICSRVSIPTQKVSPLVKIKQWVPGQTLKKELQDALLGWDQSPTPDISQTQYATNSPAHTVLLLTNLMFSGLDPRVNIKGLGQGGVNRLCLLGISFLWY